MSCHLDIGFLRLMTPVTYVWLCLPQPLQPDQIHTRSLFWKTWKICTRTATTTTTTTTTITSNFKLYRIRWEQSEIYVLRPLPKGPPRVAFSTPRLLSCYYNHSCPYAHRNRSYCGVPMKLFWGSDLLICHRQKCDHISFVCVLYSKDSG